MQSIFSLLWKRKDIPEDFRTEILSWVLRTLSNHSRLGDFFKKIGLNVKFNNPNIITQETAISKRFDIVIYDSNNLIIFENKWDSFTDINQLKRYDDYLRNSNKKFTALIHVTKDYKEITQKFNTKFIKLTWGKLYELLSEYRYNEIVKEFLIFLEEEGIAMHKVTWEIINGAKAIYSLTRIIARACEELNLNHRWINSSSDYTAQCIDGKLYVYFLLKEAKLYFCVYGDQKFSDVFSERLWSNDYGIFFDFDKECFFHKNLEEQIEIIKNYIRKLIKIINGKKKAQDNSQSSSLP